MSDTQKFRASNELIGLALAEFDFDKVQRVMKFLDWRWRNNHVDNAVPTIEELKAMALRLFDGIECGGSCRSGGFEAYVTIPEGEEIGEIGLKFWLERSLVETY